MVPVNDEAEVEAWPVPERLRVPVLVVSSIEPSSVPERASRATVCENVVLVVVLPSSVGVTGTITVGVGLGVVVPVSIVSVGPSTRVKPPGVVPPDGSPDAGPPVVPPDESPEPEPEPLVPPDDESPLSEPEELPDVEVEPPPPEPEPDDPPSFLPLSSPSFFESFFFSDKVVSVKNLFTSPWEASRSRGGLLALVTIIIRPGVIDLTASGLPLLYP
ncbi:MAG: hypothetical protein A4E71_01288 [Smithella sp. PtaU1.Bin162]|nr:MAG: hypothetical protein A4E71_01288 [Smithella sp. PtaU1.Bin162]